MTLTVPQGGNVAGRSANIQIDAPDVGAMFSRVGSVVAEKMGQIKAEQRAVVTAKTQIDMTKELGEERLRFEQMTDPAQIDAEWPQVEAQIRDKYVNQKDANGNPLLTPQEADALGLTLQDLSGKHALALGERVYKLTDSQAAAAWSSAQLDIVNTAATADPDTMAALIEYGEAAIDRLPGLMPDEKETQKQALRAEVANSRVIAAIDQDPVSALEGLRAGTYDPIGPEAKAQRIVAAQAEIDRRAAAEATMAEAEATQRSSALDKRLGEIATMEGKGLKTSDRDWVIAAPPEVQASPKWAEARSKIDLNDELPNLDQMTLAELDAQIAAEEGRSYDHEWQASRLTVLKEIRDKRATALTTDPKAALIDVGVILPTDLSFDPQDPEAFAAALADSISQDKHARETGHTDRTAIFTNDDRAALKSILAPGADADAKASLATAIVMGAKGDTTAVLDDLEADPIFRRTVKILGLTGDGEMAKTILRGQQKLDLDTTLKLPAADQIRIFDDFTGSAFDDAPIALRKELMAAATAIYADSAKGFDPTNDPSTAEELYKASLQRLLGAQTDRNGDYTVGGLQEVNGGLTVLPYGVTVGSVEGAWEKLENDLAGTGTVASAWPNTKAQVLAPTADPLQHFKTASIYPGAVPDLGSDPARRFATLTLRRVGESEVYELMVERGGRMEPITIKGSDRAYRFRLKDLVFGVRP